jgi:hypothetical protein
MAADVRGAATDVSDLGIVVFAASADRFLPRRKNIAVAGDHRGAHTVRLSPL